MDRRLARRALALAAALAFTLLSIPLGGQAATASGPSISLDPPAGPAGTTVRVTPAIPYSADCIVLWDSVQQASFTCGPDRATGFLGFTYLPVPRDAAPGPRKVTVCVVSCDGIDATWQDTAVFTVLAVVPDLRSHALSEVRDLLKAATLSLGAVDGPSESPGTWVVAQRPAPGTSVDPGSAVAVTVALPQPELVPVPDLRALTRKAAEARTDGAGLELRVSSGSGPVVSQAPSAGRLVRPGSVVTVVLATPHVPPSPVLVPVPDLVGLTRKAAGATAGGAGLELRVGSGSGVVQSQDPPAGTRVLPRSVVTVTLAPSDDTSAPALVIVPDLRHRAWDDARAEAEAAGLVLRSGRAHAGTVTGQSPAPGTRVSRGSAVTVTLAFGPTSTLESRPRGSARLAVPWTLVPAAIAAAALVLVALRGFRRRRPPRRRPPRIEVVMDRVSGEVRTAATGPRPTVAVGVVPHPDHGRQILQEARR